MQINSEFFLHLCRHRKHAFIYKYALKWYIFIFAFDRIAVSIFSEFPFIFRSSPDFFHYQTVQIKFGLISPRYPFFLNYVYFACKRYILIFLSNPPPRWQLLLYIITWLLRVNEIEEKLFWIWQLNLIPLEKNQFHSEM